MVNNNEFPDLDVLKKDGGQEPQQTGKEKKGYFYSGLIVGMAASLLIVSSVYLGTRVQNYMNARQQAKESAQQADGQEQSQDSVLTKNMLQKLQTVEAIIRNYYYQEDIDLKALEEGAYRGMVDSLGDPYSEYFSAEELKELTNQIEGIYFGIGASVGIDKISTLPKITAVFAGTPAEEAGLRPDDIIYEVDGESTYGLTLSEAVSLIKGPEGTHVQLTIVREGESNYLQIDVERRKVETPTVNTKMLEEDTAYIQITEFDAVTPDQFADALATARGNGMKGLILDVRGNPGGSLDAVVDVARMLLPEGMIVYTEDRNGKRDEYTCDGTRQIDVPLVLLIDGNSASASEILAGAIKDYGIGTLVGTTTFGKGIVQQPVPLKDGSAVKVTISSYYTPNGINIHGTGIEPDVECLFDAKAYYGEEHFDNQLDKAQEVLRNMK